MNVEETRQRLVMGFKPFSMFLSDGRKYDVPHPHFILVTRRSVAVADPEGFIDTVDPLHIVLLKDLTAIGADDSKSPPLARQRKGHISIA